MNKKPATRLSSQRKVIQALGPILSISLATGTVSAQNDTESKEKMTVTGSRIKREDMTSSSPLTIIDRDKLMMTGAQTVTDVLKELPSVIGNSLTTATTNGGGGGAGNITLRGLPATSTLVLLNGRRLPNDGTSGETPDLNAIPVAAIERVEVLKDGASAVYGSDAIAGVVNIITRKDFEGFEFDSYYGMSSRGDLETKNLNVTYGSNTSKGNILIGANFYDQGKIKSRDRDVSKRTLSPSSATPNGHVILNENQNLIANDNASSPPEVSDFRPYDSTADAYNFAEITDAIMAQERKSIFINGRYDFNSDLYTFFESSYTNTVSRFNSAPTPLFLNNETGDVVVKADNTYNKFGQDLSDVRKRLTELGPRVNLFDSDTFRFVGGFGGYFSNSWSWDLAYNYGETKTIETSKNIVNKTNLILGLGGPNSCDGLTSLGCVPVNILGPEGSIDEAQKAWIRAEANIRGKTTMESLGFSTGGDLFELPAGVVGIATGVEFRNETIDFEPGSLTSNYNTIGNTNFKPTSGDREVKEVFVEALVPILSSLDLELAARYSDYSDFGDTTNPKVGLKYRPISSLVLRGTYSTGFRAPSLRELYQGQAENFAFIKDPCQNAEFGCSPVADPDINQFLALEGGNPDLKPEKSDSYTFGLAYSPSSSLNMKADYFYVETDNAIDTSPQFIVDQFRKRQLFADKIVLDENNNIKSINAIALNLSKRKVRGIDFEVDYTIPQTGSGRFTLGVGGTHYLEYKNQPDASAPFENIVGKYTDSAAGGRGSIPEWKGNFSLLWGLDQFETIWTTNYVSELETDSPKYPELAAFVTHDIQLSYFLQALSSKVSVGIDNILDEKPPVTDSAANDNIDARTHNLVGTFYYAQWSLAL